MTRRRRGTVGTRVFGGRYYLLAGRGTKEACQAQAARDRREHYVRVVPYHPFLPARIQAVVDDWAVFTFPKEKSPSKK